MVVYITHGIKIIKYYWGAFKTGEIIVKKLFDFLIRFIIFVGTFAAIFAVSTYAGYLYITPSSYIGLNCNYPVEFSVNAFDRVINVETDGEGKDIIDDLELNNMNISEAVQKTIDELVSGGFISDDSSLIISVSNKDENKTSHLMKKLQKKVNIDGNFEIQMVKMESVLN